MRVRVHGNIARIETDPEFMGLIVHMRSALAAELKEIGVDYVTLDLEGFRSGSMDINIKNELKQD